MRLPSHAKFCENRLRRYTSLGKFITKIPLLENLGPVSSRFESHNGEFWREGADLGLRPPRQIL